MLKATLMNIPMATNNDKSDTVFTSSVFKHPVIEIYLKTNKLFHFHSCVSLLFIAVTSFIQLLYTSNTIHMTAQSFTHDKIF